VLTTSRTYKNRSIRGKLIRRRQLQMWGWGGSNTKTKARASNSYPAARASISRAKPHTRSEQIQSYINDPKLRQSTRKISNDPNDTTFDTVFLTKDHATLCLRVFVPRTVNTNAVSVDFCPAPIMTLIGVRAAHPWLDNRMRVTGFQPILTDDRWNQSNLLLGQAVCSVVEHLQLHPPTITEFTDEDLASQNNAFLNGAQPPSYTSVASVSSAHARTRTEESEEYHIPFAFPTVPDSFKELESMTGEEMRAMIFDDAAIVNFFASNEKYSTHTDLQKQIEENNLMSAEKTLARKDDILALNAEVSLLQEKLKGKIAEYEPLERRYAELSDPPCKKSILKKLNQARREASVESDNVSEKLISGDVTVDEYVKDFMEKRTLYHDRAAKMERLQHS